MAELGHNSVSAEMLRGFVERFENLKAQKDDLSDDQKQVMAEAKSNGFVPKAIRKIAKMRAMKPSDLAEGEALIDTYRHAMGMASELPLFRHVGLMGVDIAKRDEVIEALKQLVPHNGSIQVETADGKPIRLTRDKDGNVTMQEILLPSAAPSEARPGRSSTPAANKADVPAVDEAGAEALGREAHAADIPIIRNPFPFGDTRRARWDKGWRSASGNDGMGPNG
jgi:uncharacterized protein (UPF0335 family)